MLNPRFRKVFDELVASGTTVGLSIAAHHLVVRNDMAKDSPEARADAARAADAWIRSFEGLQRRMRQVAHEHLPVVLRIRHECGGSASASPAAGNVDIPFDDASRKGPPSEHVRPSHVIRPGPLDPKAHILRDFADEDLLRMWCVYSPNMLPSGRLPVQPLLVVDGESVCEVMIARMYRARRIRRTWPGITDPIDWDIDTALVEDLVLLMALLEGPVTSGAIVARVQRLEPFVRRFTRADLPRAAIRARRAWEDRGVFKRCAPRTVKLRADLAPGLRDTLLRLWVKPLDERSPGPGEDHNNGGSENGGVGPDAGPIAPRV